MAHDRPAQGNGGLSVTSREEWREVPGSEGRYRVSSYGRLIGPRGRFLGTLDEDGYVRVHVFPPGLRMMHRCVAAAFIGGANGREIDHINGDRADNRPENLRYCTHAENNRYTAEGGRGSRGENHARARFTEADVLAIRASYPAKRVLDIAAGYGCHKRSIYYILSRETWKHL